jgi:hypothetical protein
MTSQWMVLYPSGRPKWNLSRFHGEINRFKMASEMALEMVFKIAFLKTFLQFPVN